MPKHLAFVCAMPMELAPLTKRLSLRRSRIGSLDVRVGSLAGRPVAAIVTGMGPGLATRGMERLLDAVEVERVVVVGITGAVDDETPLGTLVLPERVVDSATGTGYRPERLGSGEPRGTMWTTDGLTTDQAVLADLRAAGVVSLDMETAAIAAVCERRRIPWSVFRVLSNHATDGSVTEEVFRLSNQDGSPNPTAIAAYLVRHPGRIPTLARLARTSKLATERAAAAAIDAVTVARGAGSPHPSPEGS